MIQYFAWSIVEEVYYDFLSPSVGRRFRHDNMHLFDDLPGKRIISPVERMSRTNAPTSLSGC